MSLGLVVAAFGAIVVVLLVALALFKDHGFGTASPAAPVAGLTIFAVFFVAAQGIERLLEPIAMLVSDKPKQDAASAAKDAQAQVDAAAIDPNQQSLAATKVQEAAKKAAAHQVSESNRKVVFWAVASAVGILSSARLRLYLLTSVGIAHPSRAMEVLATGLIIGGGTKPLHDLVELISAKKEAAQAAASTS